MNVSVDAKSFLAALKRIKPFVAKDWDRPVLKCVYLEKQDNALRLVGANGFILGFMDVAGDWSGDGSYKALVEPKALEGLCKGKKGAITLEFTGMNQEEYYRCHPEYALDVSGLVCTQGHFPDYNCIMPKWERQTTTAILDALEFRRIIDVVSVFKKYGLGYMARLGLNGGFKLEVHGEELGECCAEADTYHKNGPDAHVFLDINYLSASVGKTGPVVVGMTDKDRPIVVSSTGLMSVIMPMDGGNWKQG